MDISEETGTPGASGSATHVARALIVVDLMLRDVLGVALMFELGMRRRSNSPIAVSLSRQPITSLAWIPATSRG